MFHDPELLETRDFHDTERLAIFRFLNINI